MYNLSMQLNQIILSTKEILEAVHKRLVPFISYLYYPRMQWLQTTGGPPLMCFSLPWIPLLQQGDFHVSRGPPTVPLTQISRNAVFFKSQNPRKVGTLCTLYTVQSIITNREKSKSLPSNCYESLSQSFSSRSFNELLLTYFVTRKCS